MLRTHKLGEADRIITLLSRRRGKIRAVAKGVRRTSSKFGARLEPFSHVDLQFAVGRTLDVVTQVESLDAFGPALTEDYPTYTAGQVMLETADRLVVEEGEPSLQQYLLLVGALRVLNRGPPTGRDRRPWCSTPTCCARWPSRATRRPSPTAPAAGSSARTPPSPPSPAAWCASAAGRPGRPARRRTRSSCWGRSRGPLGRHPRHLHGHRPEASGITSAFATWHLDRNLRSLVHVER